MEESKIRVGIIGAELSLAQEFTAVLEDRRFPVSSLEIFSLREGGAAFELEFDGEAVEIQRFEHEVLGTLDLAFVCTSGLSIPELSEAAAGCSCVIIDLAARPERSGAVPVIVPELNGAALRSYAALFPADKGFVVAAARPAAIQLAVVLAPISAAYGLRRIHFAGYYGASSAGQAGMDELWAQTLAVFNQQELPKTVFNPQLAFNCLPAVGRVLENVSSEEEQALSTELRLLLELPQLPVDGTAALIPVMSCHSHAVSLQTEKHASVEDLKTLLRSSPGVILAEPHRRDDESNETDSAEGTGEDHLELNALGLAGTDAVYVGRVRPDRSLENGFQLWIVADDLRKGAALNAVEIAEIIAERRSK